MSENKNLPKDRPGGRTQPTSASGGRVTSMTAWQAPLPPPQVLAEFEAIVPGSAEKIIQTFTSEVQHRQGVERAAVAAEIRERATGQWMAFLIIVIFGSLAFGFTAIGYPVAGVTSLLSAILAAAGVLYIAKNKKT